MFGGHGGKEITGHVAVDEFLQRSGIPRRFAENGAKVEIYELIGELVEQGVAVLLISSDMPELLGLSDRIAVMHEGTLQGVLPRAEATQERIMELALQFTG